MDPSSVGNFTNLLNSSVQNQDPDASQQFHHSPPSPFPMNHSAFQYAPGFQPHHPSFNPYGHHTSFPQIPFNQGFPYPPGCRPPTYANYGGAAHVLSSSPVESSAMIGAFGTTRSHSYDSGSPMFAAQAHQKQHVEEIESDDNSPEEERRRERSNWSEKENMRLISSWLSNSTDPIEGNARKSEYYWKQVAKEYNKNSSAHEKRTAAQCKGHWNKTTQSVSLFHASYMKAKNMYASGQCDEGLMNKARAFYRNDPKVKKPFALEYWWKEVKDHTKWRNMYMEGDLDSKRQKLDALGAFTSSSNQDSEGTTTVREKRPIGTGKAKVARKEKGKGKGTSNLNPIQISEETSQFLREGEERKAVALEKWAEATKEKAIADTELAQARKERAKADTYS